MKEVWLDNVSYSKDNNLILSAIAYSYSVEDKKIEKLGVWSRKDIINAIKSGHKTSRSEVGLNCETNYVGQCICQVTINEIDGETYLINSDYIGRNLKKEDMIELNEGHK